MDLPIMNERTFAAYTQEADKAMDKVTIHRVPLVTVKSVPSSLQGQEHKKPSSAHWGSKLKSRFKGGSAGKYPKDQPESRPGSSRRNTIEVEPSGSSNRRRTESIHVAVAKPTAPPSNMETRPDLKKESSPVPTHIAKQILPIEKGTSPTRQTTPHGTESTVNEINKQQKELKRARLEFAEALARYSKLENEYKQSRDGKEQIEGLDLRQQYQEEGQIEAAAANTEHSKQIDQLRCDLQNVSKEREDLKKAMSELEKNFEEAFPKWKACHNRLVEVKAKSQQQEEEMNSVRETNQGLANRVTELEGKLKDLQARGEVQYFSDPNQQAMADEVAYLTEENQRIHEQLNRLVEQSASEATKNIDSYYFDDPFFERQFSSLRGSVKDWAVRVFAAESTKIDRKPSSDAEKKLRTTSDSWDLYMKSNDHRVAFVQAYVWGHLLRSVFEIWQEAEGLHTSLGHAAELQRLFHAYRSATARWVAPKGREKQAIRLWATQNMSRTLDNIIDPLEAWSTLPKPQSCRILQAVLEDVVLLDLHMRQQKAYFQICGPREVAAFLKLSSPHDVVFNSQSMESRWGTVSERGEKQRVELFIAPMLVRRGKADGQDYGGPTTVLEKAEVDLKRPKSMRSLLGI